MADNPATEKVAKTATASGAESPTTARELDFDDDGEATTAPTETIAPPPPSKSPKPAVRFSEDTTDIPPPKPPRPMNPQQQAETTLIEAFPDIDAKVVKAVLVASGGKVEPAFNALLSMSDPTFQAEEAPPPQPPRPSQPKTQLEADEQYARQLAQHYESAQGGQYGYGSRERGNPPTHRQRQQTGLKPNELYDDREHSFFDDDLPEIKKNIEQGFLQTQTKVNKWITDFRKKFEGEDDDDYNSQAQASQQRQNLGPSTHEQLYGIRKSAEMRRSSDRDRYDSDNRVLGDDFEQLELRDNDGQPRSSRPLANPDLFKPTPLAPPQSGAVDEGDALYRNPSPNHQSGGRTKKWQPLTSVAPNPEPDDHDPFSLGDSDEEDAKTKDVKAEDTERLKNAAEAKSAGTASELQLEPVGTSGSVSQKDATAEALLKEAK
ncbi:hypothetical protein P154DRAFT_583358 [Amniculicola lignicola CBS 123094]|uniref:CUE domain-containing protein n=1 Tax=Amniculicola lignicola CBS 123094 TaxID=1392246 RepID=A0A6A5VW24_9PLEO|nr:hypothetical protein P154DRAFT_583358 [Amniculicola lignicola CBS 123094]